MISDSLYNENNQVQDKIKLISRMTNSILYFLSYVFILKESGEYRLVINHAKAKLHDCRYKTLRGARVACARLIQKRQFKKTINPDWTFFYPVDEEWLMDKLEDK